MQPPKVRKGKTPIQKPLCRLCECPTSDGHVLASQVDRFKLRKWAMEVMNLTEEDENLPDVVEEDALICYFCIWQAEFGDESGDEAVAWWPKNLDLEENARVLRENYSVGEVEQCWVQLEEVNLAKYEKKISKKRKLDIDLAKYEKEIPKKRKYVSGVCIYCGNRYGRLMVHVKQMHKEAIKCGILGCTTYFHTEVEKEQHMQQDIHEKANKPRKCSKIYCKYCQMSKLYSSLVSWKWHMKSVHPELLVACTRKGCQEYFKSKSEMILHFNSSHKQCIKRDLLLCKHCEFFATDKFNLRKHIEGRHMPKIFKCDSCDAKFGSTMLVNRHFKQYHTFHRCKSCGQDVTLGYKAFHTKPSVCSRCKLSFVCSGLYQSHRKKCKQTLLSCKECGKSFSMNHLLNHHLLTVHSKTEICRCDHCDYSTFDMRCMQNHMKRKHLPKTMKCEFCNKLYGSEPILKHHISEVHRFLRCVECDQKIRHRYMIKHQTVRTCRRCECKFKCRGLLDRHIKSCVHENNNYFYCDKCPKMYVKKLSLYLHIVSKHIEI
ncbi:PR domain zinc finger protein 5-like isoform X1 [Cloeon dipterum]|uniref:PR domain zinc finger protein 5-like isoform X1 n=1 Tax=Cloeon dipterum TaxID=197152 RepID=UPI00322088AE